LQQRDAVAGVQHHTALAHAAAPQHDSARTGVEGEPQSLELLVKLRKAAALMYNVTGDAACFTLDMSGPGAASVGELQHRAPALAPAQPSTSTTDGWQSCHMIHVPTATYCLCSCARRLCSGQHAACVLRHTSRIPRVDPCLLMHT
jgi:hypothetical protein